MVGTAAAFVIGVAAGLVVTIIVSQLRGIFSPIEKEIREIYRAVLNVEKNLEDFMKAEGHGFEKYKIEYLTTPFDEWSEVTSEGINRNAEIQWEATREKNELIKNLLDSFMEKLEEHFEKYPFPSVPVVKMNEGDEYIDITNMEHTGGGAAISPSEAIIMNAVLGALPGAISTAFENSVPAALENAVQSVIEKTGGVVDGEGQMAKEEMIGAMVEGMEEVPEQYKEIRRIVERNQTLIYSYQD